MRCVGVTSRGVRLPVLKTGDNLRQIVVDSVLKASENEGFKFHDRDVVAITESIVARCQGNYASVDNIADDVRKKTGGDEVAVIFPILSRNRFAILLKGIARGVKKVYLMLSYPSDEVGNALITADQVYEAGINPYSDVLTLEKYRELFTKMSIIFCTYAFLAYICNKIISLKYNDYGTGVSSTEFLQHQGAANHQFCADQR